MEITHPFHPLRGKRFQLLKTKNDGHQQILMLRGTSRGTFAVPRDWTDRALPAPEPTQVLEWDCLLQLVHLIEQRLDLPAGS